MTSLPPALRRWGPELEGVVPDLAAALGPMLLRLDRLFGPMARVRPDPGGDPDGWDDLDRRGPYDRLLLSEWALLDVAPDEFVRRASEGEHRFHRVHRVAPLVRRRALAVFDVGPSQLGGPRVVQLAAAVVLARRARVAGLTLQLATAQTDGPARPWAGVDTLSWLARSPSASRADADKRLDALGPIGPDDDVWWLGGPGAPTSVSSLTLDDVDEPDVSAVLAACRPRRGGGAKVILARPAADVEKRWLTEPGAAWPTPAAPRRRRPKTATDATPPAGVLLGFTPDGQRVLVRDADHVYAVPIPSGPGASQGHAVSLRLEPDLVGAVWQNKALHPVRLTEDLLTAHATRFFIQVRLRGASLDRMRREPPLIGQVLDLNGGRAVVLGPATGAGPVFVLGDGPARLIDEGDATSFRQWRTKRFGALAAWTEGVRVVVIGRGLMQARTLDGPPTHIAAAGYVGWTRGALAYAIHADGAVEPLPARGGQLPARCPLGDDVTNDDPPRAVRGVDARVQVVRGDTAIDLVVAPVPVDRVLADGALGRVAWSGRGGAYGVVTLDGIELLRVEAP